MTNVRIVPAAQRTPDPGVAAAALDLAARLPHLILEARRVQTALPGIHGRRRSGPGEEFWQFRPFSAGESASRIDWRRSGRDDRLYVREREWEASHAIHLWIDRSPSMGYASSLASAPKSERALVIGLALADALVDGGERVGLIGLLPPRSSRGVAERLADALLHDTAGADADLPQMIPLAPTAEAVIVTDALVPTADFTSTIASLSSRGARGHVVRVLDPVEETFPFVGEAILEDIEGPLSLRVGNAAEWGQRYRERFAAHAAALASVCTRAGWTFTTHHTDRPATEIALRAMSLIADGRRSSGAGGR
jgi:uncharacterized protein (DUF58 family)